jgi:hypothetical protein
VVGVVWGQQHASSSKVVQRLDPARRAARHSELSVSYSTIITKFIVIKSYVTADGLLLPMVMVVEQRIADRGEARVGMP